jgi:hypothetical protein
VLSTASKSVRQELQRITDKIRSAALNFIN